MKKVDNLEEYLNHLEITFKVGDFIYPCKANDESNYELIEYLRYEYISMSN